MQNSVGILRDAFITIRDKVLNGGFDSCRPAEIVNICDSALAVPLRNCDVGSADEQTERHESFCDKQCMLSCRECPFYKPMITDIECFSQWAQSPYQEGETKCI